MPTDYAYTSAPPGFRLPAETGLGVIHLQVANLARSMDYYQHVIGLRRLDRGTLGAPGDGAGHDETPLVVLHEQPGATPVPKRGRLGLYHFAILLPDRAALGRLIAHLDARGVHAGMADHLVSEAIYLTDPDGLGIEVYADRPRSSWRTDGAMLAMASDALDVHGLLHDAGTVPWTGVPAGTRIGHVHLFVDELGRASEMFHQALGFDRVMLPPFPGALFMSAGGYHHHLGTNTWAGRAPLPGENDARLIEWTVVVPDESVVDAARQSALAGGYGVTRDGAIVDPWGTRVRVTTAANAKAATAATAARAQT